MCIGAFLIHTSAIFFLVFLIGKVLQKRNKIIIWFSLLFSVLMIIGKEYILKLASYFVNKNRIERYFYSSDGVGIFGLIAYVATIVCFVWLAEKCITEVKKNSQSNTTVNILESFYCMFSVIWCAIPLTTFDTNFFRVQRPLWIILYITLVKTKESGVNKIRVADKYLVNINYIGVSIAFLGLLFYICVFNFNVIQAFLF